MGFFGKTLSVLASDPLFSTVITFCTLILLYFPNHFLLLVFSPILISTSFLLLSLLRLGAIQRSTQPPTSTTTTTAVKESNINAVVPTTKHGSMILDEYHKPVLSESNEEFSTNLDLNNSTQQLSITHHDLIIDDHAWVCSDLSAISSKCDSVSAGPTTTTKSFYSDSFVEWDLRAPLEVIYEEYEGEEEEEEGKREVQMAIIERYASLSKFYPETDSDISSEEDLPTFRDWDSPERVCFQWEGDDKEGMIEIELGRTKKYSEDEEENLIEIDLYPASYPTVPAGKNKKEKENDHFPMMIR